MFRVNNENARKMSLVSFCKLRTYFIPLSSVSTVNFWRVCVGRGIAKLLFAVGLVLKRVYIW